MIFILLPAFNEEKSLPPLMPKLTEVLLGMEEPYRIVLCDDGSSDRTGEIAKEYLRDEDVLLTHEINRGLGETVRDLYEYAAAHSDEGDVLVRFDCDDTHEPKYIASMVAKIREGYDVVTASRFQPGGGQHGVSGYRAFISAGAQKFMKLFFPMKGVKEYSCGFRAYRASIIKRAIQFYGNDFIQLKGLGFTCTLEKLVKLNMLGARFAEVPFELRYDQKVSGSKMVSSITMLGYMTMAVIYHWPWGGWRTAYRKMLKEERD